MFGLDIGTGFDSNSSKSASPNLNSDELTAKDEKNENIVIESEANSTSLSSLMTVELVDNLPLTKSPTTAMPSTSSAYPLLTSQFYSIYNILYSINDRAFEDVLIDSTITSLTKSRVDSLNFTFFGLNEELHEKFNCAHDLLMRIDHLFR